MHKPTLAEEIAAGLGLSMGQGAKLFPPYRGGRPVNPSTVWRWCRAGVSTPAGVVRLEALRCGGRWLTSAGAVRRFLDAQTAAYGKPAAGKGDGAPSYEAAVAELAKELDEVPAAA